MKCLHQKGEPIKIAAICWSRFSQERFHASNFDPSRKVERFCGINGQNKTDSSVNNYLLSWVEDTIVDSFRPPKWIGIVELQQVDAPSGIHMATTVDLLVAITPVHLNDFICWWPILLFVITSLLHIAFISTFNSANDKTLDNLIIFASSLQTCKDWKLSFIPETDIQVTWFH